MKKLLLVLLCLPMIGFGQSTLIAEYEFEYYLETNGMGDGNTSNGVVPTSAIDTLTNLDISNFTLTITSLTSLADFINLRSEKIPKVNMINEKSIKEKIFSLKK